MSNVPRAWAGEGGAGADELPAAALAHHPDRKGTASPTSGESALVGDKEGRVGGGARANKAKEP